MSKIILLILTCERYRHKMEYQRRTWLKNLPSHILYYHVIGDSARCGTAMYRFDHHNRMIYTNTKDDYLSLPHKVITAMQAIHETVEYDYIYKTDDDQNVINPHFFSWLDEHRATYDYGGRAIDLEDHHSTYWTVHNELPRDLFLQRTLYCIGRFYFLSNRAVAYLMNKKEPIASRCIEDHAIGLNLSDELKYNCLRINDFVAESIVDHDQ
jgi:hypothetical protein